MVAVDYNDFQELAIEMIHDYGTELTLTNPSDNVTKAIGVFTALTKNDRPNTNIQQQVMNLFISPDKKVLKRPPEVGDYVDREQAGTTVRWVIEELEEVQPGDTVILYKARVHK